MFFIKNIYSTWAKAKTEKKVMTTKIKTAYTLSLKDDVFF